ncbi:3-(3-hydroxy-phenyl)propionate/3-hydroxycinnamic acid hydroxylase [BD1-7 clade bacterium]|uniref:3-(3-hydroxy-phenyl)propionate/3-hydroxycinnamic acid hydroxylase n=1 Tax=BD1-7 clade bacterium TaxID=2029982 RepID=A0A5S9P3U5_9GAMM|nr:3-(3-hydroxy-phenyl)propionate/3-hydroxycinnamic acid hydroxylase [BD1-7 clade bacterium]
MTDSIKSHRTDILIVGLGPVGAALACILGQYNISTVVVEKDSDIFQQPRAIALDNEALRILQMIGLEDNELKKVIIPEVQMHCPYSGNFGRANAFGSTDGHPNLITFYQPDLETTLRDKLKHFKSVKVMLNTTLESFDQSDLHVSASLTNSDSSSLHITCKYLIGADGAKSFVRKCAGLDFSGKTHKERWLIVDAFATNNNFRHVEFLCDPHRPVAHLAAPKGRQRWEFMLHPHEKESEMMKDQSISTLLRPWGDADKFKIERKAVYHFHSRVADAFSSGRVFLVGDAAHVTPPFVGQGLVSGLRDVANLGWKLAWVCSGKLPNQTLNSYSVERQPHVKAMISLARLMGRIVMPKNKSSSILIHGLVRIIRLIPVLKKQIDELEIKPSNRIKNGLFVKSSKRNPLCGGHQIAQGYVKLQNGEISLSDCVFDYKFSLIGFDIDPSIYLQEHERKILSTYDVNFYCIRPLGYQALDCEQLPTNSGIDIEDITGSLLNQHNRNRIALIRPDGFIIDSTTSKGLGRLVERFETLLNTINTYQWNVHSDDT